MLQIEPQKLKEFLVNDGLITSDGFDDIVLEAKRMGQDINDILISHRVVTQDYLYSLFAKYFGVEKVNLSTNIDESVLKLLPEDLARQKRVMVFSMSADGVFGVAMDDPSDLTTIEFLEKYLKGRIKPFLATPDDLNKGFTLYSKRLSEDFRTIIEENVRASLRSKTEKVEEAAKGVPIVAIMDNLLAYAFSLRSSDIHIEILEDDILVRFRVDGILHEIVRIPKEVHPAIVARIKLLGGLKLDEHSKPQDGRFRYKIGSDFMDVRVSVIPTFHGEKVEMRLLAATQRPLSLEELGMFEDAVKIIEDNIKKSYGMILVCGPTGSGKTTTLYSILNMLNRPDVNIVTIEDPIEYDMKYVNQTQINNQAGITFANGLRSILRQDPNIIMVGEIRDEETAEISVHSALTGHLVVSSLHTNDAPSTIPRMIDMKVEPFLIAAVLNVIVAQRLVRKICLQCIESYNVDEGITESIKKEMAQMGYGSDFKVPKSFYHGKGCSACGGTGYRGRMGIYEAINVTETIRKEIIKPDFSLDSLKETAIKEGMITMFEDGLRKVERGLTTIEEVLRVIRE